MADYRFKREARTPYSEVYVIDDGEHALGRVDVHYTGAAAHATLDRPRHARRRAGQRPAGGDRRADRRLGRPIPRGPGRDRLARRGGRRLRRRQRLVRGWRRRRRGPRRVSAAGPHRDHDPRPPRPRTHRGGAVRPRRHARRRARLVACRLRRVDRRSCTPPSRRCKPSVAPEAIYDGYFRHYTEAAHRAAGGGEWQERFTLEAYERLIAEHLRPDPALANRASPTATARHQHRNTSASTPTPSRRSRRSGHAIRSASSRTACRTSSARRSSASTSNATSRSSWSRARSGVQKPDRGHLRGSPSTRSARAPECGRVHRRQPVPRRGRGARGGRRRDLGEPRRLAPGPPTTTRSPRTSKCSELREAVAVPGGRVVRNATRGPALLAWPLGCG